MFYLAKGEAIAPAPWWERIVANLLGVGIVFSFSAIVIGIRRLLGFD